MDPILAVPSLRVGPIVGCKEDDRFVINPEILEQLNDLPDLRVHICHGSSVILLHVGPRLAFVVEVGRNW
eukprot:CAMPEP_0206622960 /NCGR_PEP_ID=MMETSP0325_2-20121206/63117_1 /ASSEMBLY_ACC=CAM_ASM_000347 /TAXON_ID=2866 /ORGANISM="Crypthecodinium cohnii, Strain Seligo" /LENGTH=69 /DNA_ID=CAMNT_0054146385 /DNA_START=385 /DNA_END=594 /DNA_ORIENTATION=-